MWCSLLFVAENRSHAAEYLYFVAKCCASHFISGQKWKMEWCITGAICNPCMRPHWCQVQFCSSYPRRTFQNGVFPKVEFRMTWELEFSPQFILKAVRLTLFNQNTRKMIFCPCDWRRCVNQKMNGTVTPRVMMSCVITYLEVLKCKTDQNCELVVFWIALN